MSKFRRQFHHPLHQLCSTPILKYFIQFSHKKTNNHKIESFLVWPWLSVTYRVSVEKEAYWKATILQLQCASVIWYFWRNMAIPRVRQLLWREYAGINQILSTSKSSFATHGWRLESPRPSFFIIWCQVTRSWISHWPRPAFLASDWLTWCQLISVTPSCHP